MDGTAVNELAALVRAAEARIVTDEGLEEVFSTRPLHRLPLPERRREEKVDEIHVGSLSAIVDYLAVQKDGLSPETHFVHVEGPRSVRIVGSLLGQGETNQRHNYLTALVKTTPFPWGDYISTEDMIIGCQARFAPTPDRDRLFRLLGNLVSEESLRVEDDGVTQRATAKSGVARVEDVSVENPFDLAPFRTFREIEPPASPFVLRLRRVEGGFRAALFEADGGAWEVEAVNRIRGWVHDQLEENGLEYEIIG